MLALGLTVALAACTDDEASYDGDALEFEERAASHVDLDSCTGEGSVTACCPAGSRALLGTAHPDSLLALLSHRAVCGVGFAGDDTVKTGYGDDVLLGGDGDDGLWGGAGDDHLAGGVGHDLLVAGGGQDVALGGADDDVVFGGIGHDHIDGGEGDDAVWGGPGDDVLVGGAGLDAVSGGPGNDRLVVRAACEVKAGEWLEGGVGHDVLVGPLSPEELQALGAHVIDVEAFERDDTLAAAASCTTPAGLSATASVVANRPGTVCVQLDAPCPLKTFEVHADGVELLSRASGDEGLGDPNNLGFYIGSESCFDDLTLTPGTRSLVVSGTCIDGLPVSDTLTVEVEPASFRVDSATVDREFFTAGEPLSATVVARGTVLQVIATSSQLPAVHVISDGEGTYRITATPPADLPAMDLAFEVELRGERGQSSRLELPLRYLPRGAPEVGLGGANFATSEPVAPLAEGLAITAIRELPGGGTPQAEDLSAGVPWGPTDTVPGDGLPPLDLGHGQLEFDVAAPSLRGAQLMVREDGADGVQWFAIPPSAVTCSVRAGCRAQVRAPFAARPAEDRQLEAQLVTPTATAAGGSAVAIIRVAGLPPQRDTVTVRGSLRWAVTVPEPLQPENDWLLSYGQTRGVGPARGARVVVANGCGQSVPGYIDSLGNFSISFASTRCPTERLRVTVDTYGRLPTTGQKVAVAKWVGPDVTNAQGLNPLGANWRVHSQLLHEGPLEDALASTGGFGLGVVEIDDTKVVGMGTALRILATAQATLSEYFGSFTSVTFNAYQFAYTPDEVFLDAKGKPDGQDTSFVLGPPFPRGSVRIFPGQAVIADFTTVHELGHVFHQSNVREPSQIGEWYANLGEPLAHVHAAAALGRPFLQKPGGTFEHLDYNGKIDGAGQDQRAVAADMHFWEDLDNPRFRDDFANFLASCRIESVNIAEAGEPQKNRNRYTCLRQPYDASKSWALNQILDSNEDVVPFGNLNPDQVAATQRRFASQPSGWVWRFAWDLHDGTFFEPGTGEFVGVLKDRAGVEEGTEVRGTAGDRLFDDIQGRGSDATPANDAIMDVLTSYLGSIGPTGAKYYVDRGSPFPDLVDLIDGMLCRGWIPDQTRLQGLRDVMGYGYVPDEQVAACPDEPEFP